MSSTLGKSIDIRDVTKTFTNLDGHQNKALNKVSLTIETGDFVVLVGHNGSGKSTLLKVIAGELVIDEGQIEFQDKRRPRLARVRQLPGDGTFGELTALENFHIFMLKDVPSLLQVTSPASVKEHAIARLSQYSLQDKLEQPVESLSQGQQQLLALELAMAREPELLLLDEHTASLDKSNAEACMQATQRLASLTKTTVVMVTHNLSDAIRYGNVLCVLRGGQIAHCLRDEQKANLSLEKLMRLCGFLDESQESKVDRT